ncbi:AMP-binding protein [Caldinitratiruptor microaerophilus]|uniref:Acyl-CoA synthetase n=1 Tax=Caldinitratiruptor microaerophilus TaxID=671077 RepID=A0AA35G5L6_9FIRM|nr:AMP-binding protein [Caldinitratiruptor microaerophilus]BDG59656.1 acyl-CoA synthetase [Caldinitratiruptor microaerophilus]
MENGGWNIGDYEVARRQFRLEVPERFNWARDVVERWAQDPHKLAMWWIDDHGNEKKLTFRHFVDRSARLGGALQKAGVRPGDRVIVFLGRVPEWWETMLACFRIGAVAAPGTVLLTPRDLRYRFELAGPAAVITDEAGARKVDEVREQFPGIKAFLTTGPAREGWTAYEDALAAAEPAPYADTHRDDPALLYFTSGTTGYPKMVLHTQSYPVGHRVTGELWIDLKPTDLHWNISDTGWAKAAWSSLCGPWNAGAAVFVHQPKGGFDARRTLDILSTYPITTLCGAPTIYRSLVLEDLSRWKFPTLRHCVGAGEPLNPEVIHTWREATGLTIRDGYGQTETVCLVANFPTIEVRPGSMGKPSPGFEVAIVDDQGNVLPPGQEGNIAVKVEPERPIGMFVGYWQNEEATRSTRIGPWYITGDRGYMDEDGYFWFVGRADDVILSSGYRIGPFEVESALLEHDAVAESAVVSSPDPVRGEIVKAFVVLAPGYSPSPELVTELQEHVKRVTAPYKYPREIEFVDSLPKTISGKIRRVELREREWKKKQGAR